MNEYQKNIPVPALCLMIAALLLLVGTASAAVPAASFNGTPTSGAAPLDVTFTDKSTGSPSGWAWFFGDENYTQAWTLMNGSAGWSSGNDPAAVALPDGTIVLMGGMVIGGAASNDTWCSTDNGATWTEVNGSSGWPARFAQTAVTLPDGTIVLMGGYDWHSSFNDTWCSTDNGATWVEVNASGGWPARAGHAAVALPDGTIVLTGGYDDQNGNFNDTWCSTDGGRTWTEVNTNPGWSARAGLAAVAMPDGSVVLMGGCDDAYSYYNDVWRSIDDGGTWTEVNGSAGWMARDGHTSVAMPDGSIVLMGGSDYQNGPFNDTWRSTDNGATWEQLPDAGWSARLSQAAVAVPDGSIVLMGGCNGVTQYNDVWRFQPAGSNEQNPMHTYAAVGTYTVTLQAYNDDGAGRATGTITVTSPVAPTASFTADPTSGTAPLTVTFIDTSAGEPTNWAWDFGDGITATGQSQTHQYTEEGTYTVGLTVGNAYGNDTSTADITVSSPSSHGGGSGGSSGGESSDVAASSASNIPAGGSVSLTFSGQAIYEIRATAADDIPDLLVTIGESSLPSGVSAPADTVYEYDEVTLYRTTDDVVESALVLFKVRTSWLEEKGLDAADVVLYRYHDGEWQALPTGVVDEDATFRYFSAQSPGFSLFAIGGDRAPVAVETPDAGAQAGTTEPIQSVTTVETTSTQEENYPEEGAAEPFPITLLICGAAFLIVAAVVLQKRR